MSRRQDVYEVGEDPAAQGGEDGFRMELNPKNGERGMAYGLNLAVVGHRGDNQSVGEG